MILIFLFLDHVLNNSLEIDFSNHFQKRFGSLFCHTTFKSGLEIYFVKSRLTDNDSSLMLPYIFLTYRLLR